MLKIRGYKCFLSLLMVLILLGSCGTVPPVGQRKPQNYMDANFAFSEVGFGATGRGFFSDRIVVWGRMRNAGDMSVETPFVMTFQLLSARGNVIDSGTRPFNGLGVGESVSFTIICEKAYPRINIQTVADLPPEEQAFFSSLTDTLSFGDVNVPLDQVAGWTTFYTE